MRHREIGCSLAALLLAGFLALAAAPGTQPDFRELARRIVQTSVSVKPGDVIVVMGGQHTLPLMEAIAIEAQEAGGMVTMIANTDAISRSLFNVVPEQFCHRSHVFSPSGSSTSTCGSGSRSSRTTRAG